MTPSKAYSPNPESTLVLERVVDVPRELVWAAWTLPEHIKKWYTPAPWSTVDCEIDLRPGGIFRTVMRSPEGQDSNNLACFLEVVKHEKLIWTDALQPGYRPSSRSIVPDIGFITATIAMATQGSGTRYTATVFHKDAECARKHEEMGFSEGWGTVLDQMVAAIRKKEIR